MANLDASHAPVLLVDDEPQLLRSASILLRSSGIPQILTLDDGRKVLPLLQQQKVSALVLDLTMPNLSGEDLLQQVSASHPEIPVIIMTATNDLETAVKCMQLGASDYVVKPVERNRLVSAIARATELRGLRDEVVSLKDQLLTGKLHDTDAFSHIVTRNQAMHSIFQYVEAVAVSEQPLLITGETGTGKELIALAAHNVSGRSGQFIADNVAGLDDNVFSDTLFGHKKGAFTGAAEPREGLIAAAKDGTLFLDEIGDLKESSQVKLLRLLQERKYYPLGSDQPRQSDARVIVATNHDVIQDIREGLFRKDLYYRLRSHHVHIPPLRERKDDLTLLCDHFFAKAAESLQKKKPTAPEELFTLLRTHHFPGNVRELEAMIFDAVARHQSGILGLQSFKEVIGQEDSLLEDAEKASTPTDIDRLFSDRLPTLKEIEQSLIDEALRRADGNQGIAAGMLGLSRQALNKRLIRAQANQVENS